MHRYYVYIVRCTDGSYYTGITNDVLRRFGEHNQGTDPKAYTYKRRPVTLVYSSEFWEVMQAITWEKIVKRWRRAKKEALIRGEYESLPILAKKNFVKYKLVKLAKRYRASIRAAVSF